LADLKGAPYPNALFVLFPFFVYFVFELLRGDWFDFHFLFGSLHIEGYSLIALRTQFQDVSLNFTNTDYASKLAAKNSLNHVDWQS
jgi:hypothetical protein